MIYYLSSRGNVLSQIPNTTSLYQREERIFCALMHEITIQFGQYAILEVSPVAINFI